jgi:Xaa-Pro aminopeptidase
VIEAASPLSVMKDVKNAIEAKGMRAANLRDSAALIKFLAELEAGVSMKIIILFDYLDVHKN